MSCVIFSILQKFITYIGQHNEEIKKGVGNASTQTMELGLGLRLVTLIKNNLGYILVMKCTLCVTIVLVLRYIFCVGNTRNILPFSFG